MWHTALKMRGESRSFQKKMAMECLDRVGISDFADRPAHRLSGGETQRVAIARALACGPGCFCWTNPRPAWILKTRSWWKKLFSIFALKGNMSILFSTHNPIQAERLARRKVFLSAGRLVAPAAVNRFSARFLQEKGILALITGRENFRQNRT
jgi:tungstate transport system ATP-binding protein